MGSLAEQTEQKKAGTVRGEHKARSGRNGRDAMPQAQRAQERTEVILMRGTLDGFCHPAKDSEDLHGMLEYHRSVYKTSLQ